MLTRRALLKAGIAGGIGAVAGGGVYEAFHHRNALELTRATLPVKGLPPPLSGLRIGLLTDIHRSQWVSAEAVGHAVSMVMAERPDLIVLGGDYITLADRAYIAPAAEALAPLSAPYGVFGILGNHDDEHDMPAALTARGVQVLKNARTHLTIRNESIDLAGIGFWNRRKTDIAAVIRGATAPVFLLAHDPRRFAEAQALGIPLVLSGHTHGGQVVLPVVGAVAARKFPVVAGSAQQNGTTLFVSRGVGTVYVPVRVNCPPEVAILTLVEPSLHPA